MLILVVVFHYTFLKIIDQLQVEVGIIPSTTPNVGTWFSLLNHAQWFCVFVVELVEVYLQTKNNHNSEYMEFLLMLPSQDTARTEAIKYSCSTSNGVHPDKPYKVKILSQKCI